MRDRTLVIAEAGVNHNGSRELALGLVDAAAAAGADIVKFQTFNSRQLVTAMAVKADYQVANTRDSSSQLAMLRQLELSADDHHVLFERARSRGIRFMSTAFNAASLAFLSGFDMPAIKVPSVTSPARRCCFRRPDCAGRSSYRQGCPRWATSNRRSASLHSGSRRTGNRPVAANSRPRTWHQRDVARSRPKSHCCTV